MNWWGKRETDAPALPIWGAQSEPTPDLALRMSKRGLTNHAESDFDICWTPTLGEMMRRTVVPVLPLSMVSVAPISSAIARTTKGQDLFRTSPSGVVPEIAAPGM